jgi:hypothetical protein
METIYFRGLRADGKGWAYGVPYFLNIIEDEPEDCVNKACIITGVDWDGLCGFMSPENSAFIEVIPGTVGQFNDYHKCYEGDKVMFTWEEDAKGGDLQSSDAYIERKEFGVCVWHNQGFQFKNEKTGKFISFPAKATVNVIGNIHETNPYK